MELPEEVFEVVGLESHDRQLPECGANVLERLSVAIHGSRGQLRRSEFQPVVRHLEFAAAGYIGGVIAKIDCQSVHLRVETYQNYR